MTFDDGILTICETKDVSSPGGMPKIELKRKDQYYFSFDTLGFHRYYTALQANQQIEAVVNVPGWGDIRTLDICIMEDGQQYRIVLAQPTTDDQGLKITRLSLERINEEYKYNP